MSYSVGLECPKKVSILKADTPGYGTIGTYWSL